MPVNVFMCKTKREHLVDGDFKDTAHKQLKLFIHLVINNILSVFKKYIICFVECTSDNRGTIFILKYGGKQGFLLTLSLFSPYLVQL
jgi:hypothetical protein